MELLDIRFTRYDFLSHETSLQHAKDMTYDSSIVPAL